MLQGDDLMETLDRTTINRNVSTAIGELDNALIYITYAKNEIRNNFSGESFDAYVDVLNSLYNSIMITKNQLDSLYR